MIIGNLIKIEDSYLGELAMLSVGTRKVVFQQNEPATKGAPEYRVVTPTEGGDVELGAAWKKRSKEGQDYLSVRFDDPTMSQPFNCAVVASKEGGSKYLLVWTRDTRKSKSA